MKNELVPNFFCLGAQKAGTTTLHKIFKQHPSFFLPEDKEAHFFHKDHLYKKGLKWFINKHFKHVQNEKLVGAFTPAYLYFTKSAERIYKTLGKEVKFIVILRNPADRAYSHYKMSKYRGYEKFSFKKAIEKEEERLKLSLDNKINFSYLDRGYYYSQLVEYLKWYPRENFLVLNFENTVKRDVSIAVDKICNFLGVQNADLDLEVRANSAKQAIIPQLNKLVVDDGSVLKKISRFVPSSVNKQIRKLIFTLNSKGSNSEKLNKDFKQELLHNCFLSDIRKLESAIGFSHKWI